ncbi:hypothetical protein [Ignavibacterium sp.]|uniref:hypothetical protein n=1 Tax=Ignavibacterium sp. TaxID=2651167 RepID=UPI00220FA73C|nr:hypothetical protein [Ignavibacterium sp.]BDQ02993.1 MAG: hypothetical protein KatS3mg037_1568 [Ignavibacterium sp.]
MKKIMLLIVILCCSSLLAQRTVSMNFDLYQNAANNIIATEGNFPLIYSGNVGGNSYYFELEQPTVEFNQNYMKMVAILKINTTVTGYFEIEIQPSIYVNYELSTDDITAFLENFPTYINTNFPQIPQWVRDKIIEHYNSLQLTMYPAKILDYAESYVPDFIDVEVSNIIFSVQSQPSKLHIAISFVVTGISPDYKAYTYNRSYAKITSNVRVDIKRLILLSVLGDIYYEFNGTMPIQKDGEAVFNVYNSNNNVNFQSGRRLIVVFQSDIRGTFLRVYTAEYMPINNQWEGPKNMMVSFD